jgi:hypothetical protein
MAESATVNCLKALVKRYVLSHFDAFLIHSADTKNGVIPIDLVKRFLTFQSLMDRLMMYGWGEVVVEVCTRHRSMRDELCKNIGAGESVLVVEPGPANLERLKSYLSQLLHDNVDLIDQAA